MSTAPLISDPALYELVHRVNIFTGVVLLSIAVYLRGVSPYHTPRAYEYAYAICGFTFFAVGVLEPGDVSEAATSLRFIRQLSVLVLGVVMFRQLLESTQLQGPQKRLRELYVRLRTRNDDTATSDS